MKRIIWTILAVFVMTLLAACGNSGSSNDTEQESGNEEEEIKALEVDFEVPETAEVGETVQLKASVTYGDEKVKDAEEMEFEYWEKGNEDDSTMVQSTNNEDGTYTAEVTFDHDGVYEMYAHTTARGMHTMPEKSITVGDGASGEEENSSGSEGHNHGNHHAEGFGMHFDKPDSIKAEEKTDLTVHLQLDDNPFEDADVRYEIWKDGSENHEYVDAEETKAGEYYAGHTFAEAGSYKMIIHVENDEGLHEHKEVQLEVTE
ncbi:FixH family protein [Lentibacillus sp.]|uniref:FixH family protein n=1 Tax=Lentibacillus sp. TaxID=1925746 RepID=UPI002B4AD697|nr:FixH family protein [Lentibacillus sp.]HLS09809.1 FixH family protein [Lentibacillus sp.]